MSKIALMELLLGINKESEESYIGLVIRIIAAVIIIAVVLVVVLARKKKGPTANGGMPSAGARFCTQCGSPITPSMKFCPQCGSSCTAE